MLGYWMLERRFPFPSLLAVLLAVCGLTLINAGLDESPMPPARPYQYVAFALAGFGLMLQFACCVKVVAVAHACSAQARHWFSRFNRPHAPFASSCRSMRLRPLSGPHIAALRRSAPGHLRFCFLSPVPCPRWFVAGMCPAMSRMSWLIASVMRFAPGCDPRVPAPQPVSLEPPEQFRDTARNADAPLPEFFTCRLTAYSSPHLFQRVAKSLLPCLRLLSLLLSPNRFTRPSLLQRTLTRLLAIFRVRKENTERLTGLALPAGCFVAPHGANTCSKQWLARPNELQIQDYFAVAQTVVLKHSSAACLAYRPGGRANLGVRTSTAAVAKVAFRHVGPSPVHPRIGLDAGRRTAMVVDPRFFLR